MKKALVTVRFLIHRPIELDDLLEALDKEFEMNEIDGDKRTFEISKEKGVC